MKALKLIFCSSLMLFFQTAIIAQTVHVVVFCDTNGRSIGQNEESERKITINEMETIAEILGEYGYDSELTECHGNYQNV